MDNVEQGYMFEFLFRDKAELKNVKININSLDFFKILPTVSTNSVNLLR